MVENENVAIHKWGICYSDIRKRMKLCYDCQHSLKLGNAMLQEVSEEKKSRKSGWGCSSFGRLFA